MSTRATPVFNPAGRYRIRGSAQRAAVEARVVVTVRCERCWGVFERPVAEIGQPCLHCGRAIA